MRISNSIGLSYAMTSSNRYAAIAADLSVALNSILPQHCLVNQILLGQIEYAMCFN